MFGNEKVNLEVLKRQAFNLRWAEVPNGVIPLTAADLDFPIAPQIQESILNYTQNGYFNYAPAQGLSEFKEAYSNFLAQKRSVAIRPANILPVDSAAFGIYLTCKTFLAPGDEAIIFNPVDFLFNYSITQVGAKSVDFKIPPGKNPVDFDLLKSLITPKTKLLCLCNPLNPTGKVFTKPELEEFSKLIVEHNLIVLSDEIWSDIVFHPNEFTSIASLNHTIAQRTILVSGFSKSYGLAGLRIGVVATQNNSLFDELLQGSLHTSTIHGANALGQIAATAALNSAQNWLSDFLKHLTHNKTVIQQKLSEIDGLEAYNPEGCYVYFVNIQATNLSSLQAQEFLLSEAKVAVVPGLPQWFGTEAEGYIRLSFATSTELLTEAMNRIKTAFEKL